MKLNEDKGLPSVLNHTTALYKTHVRFLCGHMWSIFCYERTVQKRYKQPFSFYTKEKIPALKDISY